MQNLSIENIGQTFNLDPVSPGAAGPGQISSEKRVVQEMVRNGMDAPAPAGNAPAGTPASFSELLRKSVEDVNQMQTEADSAVKELIAGRSKNIHETMLTVERADVSLKLMMQVRNKIIDAYKEIMRMQV
jgi:flagellar hook-basal body complex protein FliE